jgi:hypothetical protein
MSQLDDKIAIQELLARYCGHLDNGRFAEMAACFTEGGTWDTAFGAATGRAKIEELVRKLASRNQPRPAMLHLTSNVIVEITGDTASATSSWMVAQNSPRGPLLDCAGNYIDKLRKVGGQWLFDYRKIDRYIAIDVKPEPMA